MSDHVEDWWTAAGLTSDLCGVFEGGGAKGIAHAGGAQAVVDHGHWFRAVAGASAGAITAALLAAGATPAQLEAWTPGALETLADALDRPPHGLRARRRFWWRALSGLASPATAAAADSLALESWLRDRLADLTGDRNVTFGTLYEHTGIELTVVAVDIMSRRHRIFCHTWTPGIQVADAVVASSSIPLALPPRRLATAKSDRYAYPVVDGGVWTNFPRFVIEDAQFRAHHHLPTRQGTLVGFLLDEDSDVGDYDRERDRPRAFGPAAQVLDGKPQTAASFWPAELLLSYDTDELEVAAKAGFAKRARVAAANSDLPDLLGDASRVSGFRTTKRRTAESNQDPVKRMEERRRVALEGLLQGLRFVANPIVAMALLVAVAVSMLAIARWAFAVPHAIGWRIVWGVAFLSLSMTLVSTFVLMVVLVLGHAALHWPLRKFGPFLAGTYAAGSGAPYWAGRLGNEYEDGVIRLPIPGDVTTTSFRLSDDQRIRLVASARDAANARLDSILGARS